jgi:hypothetical protein
LSDGSKLIVVTLFIAKNRKKTTFQIETKKRKKKVKAIESSSFSSQAKEKKNKKQKEKKMQRKEGAYLSSLAFVFGMKHFYCLLLSIVLQC